jgi:hypothetical protein
MIKIQIDTNAIRNSINAGLRSGMTSYADKAAGVDNNNNNEVARLVRAALDRGEYATVDIKTGKVK